MDDKLTPATARDVEACLSLALTSGSSLARNQAAEVTAKVVAERLVAQLERSGFVIMRKPTQWDTRNGRPSLSGARFSIGRYHVLVMSKVEGRGVSKEPGTFAGRAKFRRYG